jgi:hypothetical protein
MPKITITTINSIMVKPACCFFISMTPSLKIYYLLKNLLQKI